MRFAWLVGWFGGRTGWWLVHLDAEMSTADGIWLTPIVARIDSGFGVLIKLVSWLTGFAGTTWMMIVMMMSRNQWFGFINSRNQWRTARRPTARIEQTFQRHA